MGKRFVGNAQVREALAGRFKGIPDVHYGEDCHGVERRECLNKRSQERQLQEFA